MCVYMCVRMYACMCMCVMCQINANFANCTIENTCICPYFAFKGVFFAFYGFP